MSSNHSSVLGGSFAFPGTSLAVNRIGYGAMQLAGPGVFGPPKDEAAALAVLRQAVEAGVNHLDTSEAYGPFVTNQIIKKALHPYAPGLVIVSKIGGKRGADKSWQRANSAAEMKEQVHSNLKNLGLEALDVVNYRHMTASQGPEEGSIAEQIGALADFKREGLIRHIGVSTVTARQIAEARSITEIVCVQNMYNVAYRADDPLIDDLAKSGIAYVPYFPLGGFSPLQSAALSAVAAELGSTPLQAALAWLLHRSANILLIPGTSSSAHLAENLAVGKLQLTPKMVATLDASAG